MGKRSERGEAGKYPYRYKYKDRIGKVQGDDFKFDLALVFSLLASKPRSAS